MGSAKKSYADILKELAKYHLHADNASHSFKEETQDRESSVKLATELLEVSHQLGAYANLFQQMSLELLDFGLNNQTNLKVR